MTQVFNVLSEFISKTNNISGVFSEVGRILHYIWKWVGRFLLKSCVLGGEVLARTISLFCREEELFCSSRQQLAPYDRKSRNEFLKAGAGTCALAGFYLTHCDKQRNSQEILHAAFLCADPDRRAGECAKTTESYFKHWGLQIRSMAALLLVLKILAPCPHAHASIYSLVPGLPLMLCLRFCFFFFNNAYRLKLNSFIWWFLEYSYQCCFFCELKLYNAPECTPTVWNNVLKEFFK